MEKGSANKIFGVGSEVIQTFRICHVSDLHFSTVVGRLSTLENANSLREKADAILREVIKGFKTIFHPSTFDRDVALELLRQIVEESGRSDLVIVTGDLATTGSDEDLRIARDYFLGQMHPLWSPGTAPLPVDSLEKSIIVLPGNHDRFDGVMLSPSSTRFENFFGNLWDFQGGLNYDMHCPQGTSRVKTCTLEKDGVGLAIISADLSLTNQHEGDGMWGYIGQGSAQLVQQLRSATQTVLAEASAFDVPVSIIWALHFPPAFPNIDSKLKLINEDELIAEAENLGVPIILAGHTHDAQHCRIGSQGQVSVVCCGSSSGISASGVYSYNSFEVDVGSSASDFALRLKTMVWDKNSMKFVEG